MPLPTIFLALGPPTLLEQPSRYSLFVRQLAARLPKPKAIVLINPLWEDPVQRITGGAELLTFHKAESAASRTLGDIVLSLDIQSCFAAESIKAEIDDRQGLDDAPWTLLRLLDRQAKLPVVAISVNPRLVPEEHYRIGQSLRILREREVLLVGCGRMDAGQAANRWSDWLNERIQLWDMETLFDYERRGPASRASANRAETSASLDPSLVHATIPSLLACMGAADTEQQGRRIYREQAFGGLHLNAWRFG